MGVTAARWRAERANLRARILDAAFAAIDRHGVRALTLVSLSEAVDADQSQVARVFSTMDDIYLGVIRHRDRSLASAFDVLEAASRSIVDVALNYAGSIKLAASSPNLLVLDFGFSTAARREAHIAYNYFLNRAVSGQATTELVVMRLQAIDQMPSTLDPTEVSTAWVKFALKTKMASLAGNRVDMEREVERFWLAYR